MEDADICGQLRQIFPQIDQAVIQRTIQEAKTNEGVNILNKCIEIVLARQEEARLLGRNEEDRNDEVVLVKSIRKETSRKQKAREIPFVFIEDTDAHPVQIHDPYYTHEDQPFSDGDSSNSGDDSSDDVSDPFPPRNDLSKDVEFPDLFAWQPSRPPIQKHIPTPIILEPSGSEPTSNWHLSTTPARQTLVVPLQLPMNHQPLIIPNEQMSSTPNAPNLSSTTTATESSYLDFVRQMFPNVNVEFVQKLSQQGFDLNGIVNMLVDRPDMQNDTKSDLQPPSLSAETTKHVNYFTEYSKMVSFTFKVQCEKLLKNDFRRVFVADIRKAMAMYNGHYAPARKLLEESLLAMNENSAAKCISSNTLPSSNSTLVEAQKKFAISRLLGTKRPLKGTLVDIIPELKLEMDFFKRQVVLNEEKKNAIYAAYLNEQQYKDEGELIECGCCFGEFPFEEIVQCSEGHLFCRECLQGYAKQVIFGSAMASAKLLCMAEDCEEPFPYNQLERCLSNQEIEKYRSRLQEDCLAKVDLPNLHQCPFCEFAAIIGEHQKVFTCMNPKCEKESCTKCEEEWKEHFGKRCNEVEKKSQTNLRVSYEERMTMAKVRKCAKCSLTFTKQDGCNKMTCRCGTTQCYVCRKSGITYDHFCRHPRDPGKKCGKCSACSLWTDPTEDEELAITNLREEAEVAKRKLNEEIEHSTRKKPKL
ncbi:E3 ubiquitin-protein ligase RNF216-like [Dendronephthya gigantea]|uniref:E3 ubiquitin-protein ligase RNF216-like n=1 Tax=Dendronephthya gigantea TaxID=151771 RepID=UPI00106A52F3|nr:E3 ubiquitin-protein ligase RNF216-like [Dendronephthya gigantea]